MMSTAFRFLLLFSMGLILSCQPGTDSKTTTEESSTPKDDLTFTNPSDKRIVQYGVSFPVPKDQTTFKLRDGNQFLPYQLDDLDQDGTPETVFTLIDFAPNETKTLKIESGDPGTFSPRTQVMLLRQPHDYDEKDIKKITGDYQALTSFEVPANLAPHNHWLKFEGPTWENDLVGFRLYADSRHRYDVFGKKVREMVLDTVDLDYHKIRSWGTDVLKVGTTLGLGSPGFMLSKSNYPEISKDSLATFEKYGAKTIDLLLSGPLRSMFRVNIKELVIGRDTLDVQIDHEMHAGHRWTEITLTILKTTNPSLTFGTGIAKHPGAQNFVSGPWEDTFFGYSWGNQTYHEELLGLGILVPARHQVRSIEGGFLDSHVLLMQPVDNQIRYRILAGWEQEENGLTANPLFLRYLRQIAGHMSL